MFHNQQFSVFLYLYALINKNVEHFCKLMKLHVYHVAQTIICTYNTCIIHLHVICLFHVVLKDSLIDVDCA